MRQRSCNECASTFYIKYLTIIQSYLASKSLRFRLKLFQGRLFWLDWLLPFVTLDLIIYFIIFERNIWYFEQCRIDISAHIYGIIYFGWGKLKLVVYLMQLRSFDFSGTSLWCAKYLFPEILVTCLRRMHVCFNLNFYDYSWPSGYELLCL